MTEEVSFPHLSCAYLNSSSPYILGFYIVILRVKQIEITFISVTKILVFLKGVYNIPSVILI